jgi:anti-sigma factor RsiW
MHCERARELLSAYHDGELVPDERRGVADHVATCRACSDILADYGRLGRAIQQEGRRAPAPGLSDKLRRALDAVEADATAVSTVAARTRTGAPAWVRPNIVQARRAAVLLAASIMSAIVSWWATSTAIDADRIEREILNAHIRSLLQDSQVQVASTDQHTVRPWFAGRTEIAPPVKDLAADGFPLIGGRLDFVDGHRASVIVYKRHLHTINVFMWPARSNIEGAVKVSVRNGYNVINWSRGGITTWLVSDLNAEEMRRLAGLL